MGRLLILVFTALFSSQILSAEVIDNFTEVSDTDISLHDPDTGDSSSWSETREGATVSGGNGYVIGDTTNRNEITNTTDPGITDYWVTVKGQSNSTNANKKFSASCRSTGANLGYRLTLRGTGDWLLIRNGAFGAPLANGTISGFGITTEYTLKVKAEGTGATVTVYYQIYDGATEEVNSSYADTDASRITAKGNGKMILNHDKATISYFQVGELASPSHPWLYIQSATQQ